MKAKIDTGQISFFSNGENLIDYTIYGAAGGVGDRTANLYNESAAVDTNYYINNNGKSVIGNSGDRFLRVRLDVTPSTYYVFSWLNVFLGSENNSAYIRIVEYKANNQFILRTLCNCSEQTDNAFLFRTGNNTTYIVVHTDSEASSRGQHLSGIMIVSDNTAPTSYEPYGYKIPVVCGGVTTNIYLDEPLYEGDSITFSMAQVDIPTNNGQNTLTVDTQVKPSKIIVKTNEGIFQNPPENKSFSDYHYNRKMDTRNEILRAWATKDNGRIVPKSWSHVQFLVKQGLHKNVFHIGDELVCKRGNDDIVWQIADFDVDTLADPQFSHSMTLVMKNCFSQSMAYSSRSAAFYFPEGLSAGLHYFTIVAQPWYNGDKNKSFGFELTQNIPKKGQLVFTHAQNETIVNTAVNLFANSESTTIIESPIIFLWDNETMTGNNLGTIQRTKSATINSIDRAFYGNDNYKESALRQWLNSDSSAGNVWKSITNFDRPPYWATIENGFTYNMDNDFLKIISPTVEITARNTICDDGGYDTTKDKFKLLSKSQIYGNFNVENINEGTAYKIFSNYSDLNVAGVENDINRIKTKGNIPAWYWLRSSAINSSSLKYYVLANGGIMNTYGRASSGGGVVVACTIS